MRNPIASLLVATLLAGGAMTAVAHAASPTQPPPLAIPLNKQERVQVKEWFAARAQRVTGMRRDPTVRLRSQRLSPTPIGTVQSFDATYMARVPAFHGGPASARRILSRNINVLRTFAGKITPSFAKKSKWMHYRLPH